MIEMMTLLRQSAVTVAPQLLGWELATQTAAGEAAGRIVEVEAYAGADDAASHAFRGRTPRTLPMFEAGGVVYVYLSYGRHTCMNIVVGPAGEAQAVLIRAIEPTVGLSLMRQRRGEVPDILLTKGPGRLTQALGITLADSGSRLGQKIQLRPTTQALDLSQIRQGPRIGIHQAIEQPWRFWVAGNPFVSGPKG